MPKSTLAVGVSASVVIAAMIACASLRLLTPDTAAVLRLVGRFGSAHACPVGEALALTSAHVTDLRPFDRNMPAFPFIWADAAGSEGVLKPLNIYAARDLALMESTVAFARWYTVAAAPPEVGERLVALGYDFRERRDMFAPRLFALTLLRIVARSLVMEPTVPAGTSGSCVLNGRGEVVGVVAWGQQTDDKSEVTVAVGVWGERFIVPEEPLK